ncbi:UNVERIFIED_CONTAM: hypothetical protein GTU68_017463 [Idotea baltica]|nr:hypothetical protein [Idotea baltica]
MAHKKGAGSTNNGRDSKSKRLGVKIYGGQLAISGNIIVRQRGTKFHPGTGVGIGKDFTIYAIEDGVVDFTTKRNDKKYISVLPIDENGNVIPKAEAAPKSKKKSAPKKAAPKKAAAPKAAAPAAEEKPAAPAANKDMSKEEKEAAKLAEIKAKAASIDFASFGSASEADKDDLKEIKGVGPFLEKKLNALGIYTFKQVSNFQDKDIDMVNDAIEFFPGRIRRDDWVGQCKAILDGTAE